MAHFTLTPPTIAEDKDRSFWLQDIAASPTTSPLNGPTHADIVIVGGGYSGLWTALRLREQSPDISITVLEADICGAGASGRNGGQVHSWFAEMDSLAHVVGEEEALFLCHASVAAIDELEGLQQQGIIDMDLQLRGWLWTASSVAQEGAWENAEKMCNTKGEPRLRTLSKEEIRERTGSDVSYTGVVEDRAGIVQPAKLAIGLRDLAISKGIEIHEKTPVTEIRTSSDIVTLTTPNGQMTANKVALATNAWLSAIPEIRRYMYVVSSEVIATEPAKTVLDEIHWEPGISICDSQEHVLYYQRAATDRVIFGRGGGHVAFRGNFGASFNRDTAHSDGNIRELHRVYPSLKGLKVTHDWAGPIDCTAEHTPMLGHLPDAPNVFFVGGLNGTGIAQTPVCARILASLILGKDDQWSRSKLVGFNNRTSLPPEPFRYIGSRIVRHAIGIRNDAEIQNRSPNAFVRYLSEMKPGHKNS